MRLRVIIAVQFVQFVQFVQLRKAGFSFLASPVRPVSR
jgi:hypothetical protein